MSHPDLAIIHGIAFGPIPLAKFIHSALFDYSIQIQHWGLVTVGDRSFATAGPRL